MHASLDAARQEAISRSSHFSRSAKSSADTLPNRVFHQGGLHLFDALIEHPTRAPAYAIESDHCFILSYKNVGSRQDLQDIEFEV